MDRTVEVQIIMLTYTLFVYSYYWIQYILPALIHPLLRQFLLHSSHPPSLYRYISYAYSMPATVLCVWDMEMNRREEAPALTEIIIFQQGRLEINKETHKKKTILTVLSAIKKTKTRYYGGFVRH